MPPHGRCAAFPPAGPAARAPSTPAVAAAPSPRRCPVAFPPTADRRLCAAPQTQHAALLRASLAKFRELAVGEGASDYEARLLQALDAEAKQQLALLNARSQALCTKVVGRLVDEMGGFFRRAPVESYAAGLPALLEQLLGGVVGGVDLFEGGRSQWQ